jgi:peroxiredoxin family protein
MPRALDPAESRRLLVLCHHGDFEHWLQATSAAAAAASAGWRVDLVFYFDALARLLGDDLDQVDSAPRRWSADPARRVEDCEVMPPSALLAAARSAGSTRVFACSASLRLLEGADEAKEGRAAERVDEVVGWPTVLELIWAADRTLYL